ncbi:MAG: muconolactone Delta-isomerase family protein [Nostoc sp.]|uniref:muconolactone Delta-isomerase family protein n=1 Tax=Nostoc sp. TaxID=1180 RepID=UPI002FEF448C
MNIEQAVLEKLRQLPIDKQQEVLRCQRKSGFRRRQAPILYAQGCLHKVWALDMKNKGAVVLFEAESQNHLQKIIDRFPLVKVDYVDYETFPFAQYPAFANKS